MALGQRVQMLRTAAGWSQEQLAEQLAVTRQTVSKWERDLSTPDADALLLLSDLFEISLDELVRGAKPEPNRSQTAAFWIWSSWLRGTAGINGAPF